MTLTETQRNAALKLLEEFCRKNPGFTVENIWPVLQAMAEKLEEDGNADEAYIYRVSAQVARERSEAAQACERRAWPQAQVTPDQAERFNWRFLLSAVSMVLFVVFTAAYEGARIGLLSDDPKAVAHVAESARSVEDLLMKENGSAGARLVSWRSRALAGDRSACRGLGLLSMTGRGSVAVPTDDIVMSRWWSLFGFSFFFGMGVFGYYVVRPLWKRCQKGPRRCYAGMAVVFLLMLSTLYVPGLIVFHFARCWYPVLSAWMVGAVSGVI